MGRTYILLWFVCGAAFAYFALKVAYVELSPCMQRPKSFEGFDYKRVRITLCLTFNRLI